jgi:hypothetical protein
MNRRLVLGCFGLTLSFLFACEGKKDNKDLTIVVEADHSKVVQQEKELQERVNQYQKDKEEMEREKSELTEVKSKMKGQDKIQAQRVMEMEKRLYEKERELATREDMLKNERQDVLKKSSGKPSPEGAGGAGPYQQVLLREQHIAEREKITAVREDGLAKREKDLAQREAELARREADFLRLQGSLASIRGSTFSRGRDAGSVVNREMAEKTYKATLNQMRVRGILWEDLQVEGAGLQEKIAGARGKGDYGKMLDLIEQWQTLITSVQINQEFISRKFQWLSQMKEKNPPSAKDKESVKILLQKSVQLSSDGDFVGSNSELNKIYTLLTR